METNIVIIDFNMGNPGSVKSMLKYIGHQSKITSSSKEIEKADKIILTGVGAFDSAVESLRKYNLIDLLNECVLEKKKPVLGICLGMQLMTNESEEGNLPGFGWVDGKTVRFKIENQKDKKLKIPHMGWNVAEFKKKSKVSFGLEDENRFYFVHSYHIVCNDDNDILSTTKHGYNFCSAIQKENIFGTQFHPEKSHKFGILLLKNFIDQV